MRKKGRRPPERSIYPCRGPGRSHSAAARLFQRLPPGHSGPEGAHVPARAESRDAADEGVGGFRFWGWPARRWCTRWCGRGPRSFRDDTRKCLDPVAVTAGGKHVGACCGGRRGAGPDADAIRRAPAAPGVAGPHRPQRREPDHPLRAELRAARRGCRRATSVGEQDLDGVAGPELFLAVLCHTPLDPSVILKAAERATATAESPSAGPDARPGLLRGALPRPQAAASLEETSEARDPPAGRNLLALWVGLDSSD